MTTTCKNRFTVADGIVLRCTKRYDPANVPLTHGGQCLDDRHGTTWVGGDGASSAILINDGDLFEVLDA